HSARDVDEAVRWVDYTNGLRDTAMTRRRRSNGREEPWRVRYLGVGNEVYRPWQMGHRSAPAHAGDAAEPAQLKRAVDPSIQLIGVGIPWDQERWTTPVLATAGRFLDHLSLHHYGASNHLMTGDDYENVVAQSLYFEREISRYSQLVAQISSDVGLDHVPQLVIDEWNMRHLEPASWPEPRAGADGGIAERETRATDELPLRTRVSRYSPRTLGDAVFSAGVLHAIHRSAGNASAVTMANPVNLLNANGIVVARPGGAVGSTLYHVWHLYRHHTGRTVLPTVVDGPARSMDVRLGDSRDRDGMQPTAPMTVPFVDVVATRAEDGAICLAVVNRHRSERIRLRPRFDGSEAATPRLARIRTLGGDVEDVNAWNSLSSPDTVAVRDHGDVESVGGAWVLPPHSVSGLRLSGSAGLGRCAEMVRHDTAPRRTQDMDRPNILLLCTDQQRFDALGAYGNPFIDTPHLDALATQGVLFENCYVQSPVCGPSRASLMTGRYMSSHGLYANGVDLPSQQRVFTRDLADAGYDCGLVGKLHLGACANGRSEPRTD